MLIYALDNLARIDQINGYTRVAASERDLNTGSWEIEIPPSSSSAGMVDRWLSSDWPGIEIHDPDTGWRFGGFLDDYTIDESPAGRSFLAVGFDYQTELLHRLGWPGFGDDLSIMWQFARSAINATPPNASWNLIDQCLQPIAGALYREPPWAKAVPAAAVGGAATTHLLQALPTLDVIREILENTAWTARARLVVDDTNPYTPRIRVEVIERPASPIVYGGNRRNAERVRTRRQAAAASHVIGVGDLTGNVGTPAERHVASAQRFTPATWENRYSEAFINRPTASATELQDDVDREADRLGPQTIVSVVNPDTSNWGVDIDIGWVAQVDAPIAGGGRERFTLPVVRSELEGTPDGFTRTIYLGSEPNDELDGVFAELAALARANDKTVRGLTDT